MPTKQNPPQPFIEGKLVALCPMRRSDAPDYARWLNDAEISTNLLMHKPITIEAEEAFLDSVLKQDISDGLILAIWHKATMRLIGNVGVHQISPRDRHATIGIFIGDKSMHGKGFGAEAIKLMLRYSFNTLNLRKIQLSYYAHNERAKKTYTAIGFKEIGRYKDHRFIDGKYRDEVLMEIFKDDFL